MVHPKYEFISIDTPLKNFYTPVYPATEGLSQKLIFKLVQKIFKAKLDTCPIILEYIKKEIFHILEALKLIHKPKKEYEKKLFDEKKSIFHQRVIYDELLAINSFFVANIMKISLTNLNQFYIQIAYNKNF